LFQWDSIINIQVSVLQIILKPSYFCILHEAILFVV
jgi:hypothetical protein